jgi:hypothetical protein
MKPLTGGEYCVWLASDLFIFMKMPVWWFPLQFLADFFCTTLQQHVDDKLTCHSSWCIHHSSRPPQLCALPLLKYVLVASSSSKQKSAR